MKTFWVPPPLRPLPPKGGEIFERICLINYGLLSSKKPDLEKERPFPIMHGLTKPSFMIWIKSIPIGLTEVKHEMV